MSDIKNDINVKNKDETSNQNVVVKKSRGRPKKNPDISEKESKREYNKMWYERNKEKAIQVSKERYQQNTEEWKEHSIKLRYRYKESYRLLKDMMTHNKLPEEYNDKVKTNFA